MKGGWELFGRADSEIVRIQPALGRITRTSVPALDSTGPVSFLATDSGAIINPIDNVPSYVVRDGQPARQMSPRLAGGGPILPSPDPAHVWVASGSDRHPRMRLVAIDGGDPGAGVVTISVPPDSSPLEAVADGGGYLLFTGTGGVYAAAPGQRDKITTGTLLAVGRTGWLVQSCRTGRCSPVFINRVDRSRHHVPTKFRAGAPLGAVAPDGRSAAVFTASQNGQVTPVLLNLASGHRTPIQIPSTESFTGSIAWSPGVTKLFVLGAHHQLAVIDPRTGRRRDLKLSLPPLRQLAVRPS